MSQRYERPAWVRRLNAMADSLGGGPAGARRLIPIDPDALIAESESALGGGPFGDFGDPGWRDRFENVVAAANESDLHVVGRLLTRQEIARSLRTRLLLGRAALDTPAIAEEEIAAPVIVTGPARSGTSILFELLWLDPALRGPVAWEALHPLPLPDAAEERRPLASEAEQELWADVQPEFAAIHELRSDLPVECVTLTAPCFCGPHWPMILQSPRLVPDIERFYDFHRRILQVLQHGSEPRTWLLKTPGHLMTLDSLFETYPDAWVVQTHRDPVKTMPSTVSTTALVQWLRTDAVDLELLASVIGAAFGGALNAVGEQREGALPDRFVDVHFQELLREPVETLRRAYDRMGRAFTPRHAERITKYLEEKPKGKFGAHRYTPEEWGFERDALREQLAPYVEHFGVELED